ncbi:MAG: hypothetical protein GY812_02470 [Actinomycetia bacterium]|nr:hypothetical protein [Actinomycetes bacterium]
MKRFVAVLGAVMMVLVAVLVRGMIDSESDGAGSPGDGGGELTELVCGPALLEACNELAAESGAEVTVTVQDEADTAMALATGELVLDGSLAWLAAGPWPEIAGAGGAEMPELAGSDVLAHSPAVIVARNDRMAAINTACGSANWSCVGDAAGGQWTDLAGDPTWGRLEVALPEPDAGDGTVAVNQAVASRVGSADYATNDLDDPAVEPWFENLARQSKENSSGTSPLTQFLRVPGSLGVVGALEAEAISQLETAAAADELSTTIAEPVAMAEVSLWAGSDALVESALGRLGGIGTVRSALEGSGWRSGPADSTGLPAPAVMSAVNSRWEQA